MEFPTVRPKASNYIHPREGETVTLSPPGFSWWRAGERDACEYRLIVERDRRTHYTSSLLSDPMHIPDVVFPEGEYTWHVEAVTGEDNLQARMQRVCATGEPYEIAHRTAYPVHQRVASSYRAGRVLLAGDAAHINNPLGGMGMNGGIHDAVNLAGKLAPVWHGEAAAETLDRYDRQRRPIAIEHVQAATLRNKELLDESDPALRRRRQDDLSKIAADPVTARDYLLRTSMISALRHAESIP